jgi:hypothetical protein
MALSSTADEMPEVRLSVAECADVLRFMSSVEPFEPRTWWQDPADAPSHLVGFHIVLQTLADSLGEART